MRNIKRTTPIFIVEDIAALSSMSGHPGALIFVREQATFYEFRANDSTPVDGSKVLATVFGGDSRWYGLAGENAVVSGTVDMFEYFDGSAFTGSHQFQNPRGQTVLLDMKNDPSWGGTFILPTAAGNGGREISFYIYNNDANEYEFEDEDGNVIGWFYSSNNRTITFTCTGLSTFGNKWVKKSETNQATGDIELGRLTVSRFLYSQGGFMLNARVSASTNYTMGDFDTALYMNISSPGTVKLPLMGSSYGRLVFIKKVSVSTSGTVTINPQQPFYNIDGFSNLVLRNVNDYVLLMADVNNWKIVSTNIPEADGNQKYGIYTPTYTPVSNVDNITSSFSMWTRIGNIISVSGKARFDILGAGAGSFRISLPVASNFGAGEDVQGQGTFYNEAGIVGYISADAVNDRAVVNISPSTGANSVDFTYEFKYRVL